jgi:uncharacterized protein DUF1761
MPVNKINHLAAITAAVVYFLAGRAWYFALEDRWLPLVHKLPSDVNTRDPVPYVIAFAMGLVVSYGIATILTRWETGFVRGAQLGAFIGIAFVAASMLVDTMYEHTGAPLWLIAAAYPAVGLTIVGAILGAWRRRD